MSSGFPGFGAIACGFDIEFRRWWTHEADRHLIDGVCAWKSAYNPSPPHPSVSSQSVEVQEVTQPLLLAPVRELLARVVDLPFQFA